MFSEMSRARLRRSKSTDVLSTVASTQKQPTGANKPAVKPASHNTQTSRLSKRKSKNKGASSKGTANLCVVFAWRWPVLGIN